MPKSKLLKAKEIQAEIILDCLAAKNQGKKKPLTLEQWFQRKESSAFRILDEMRAQIAARNFDRNAMLAARSSYSKRFTGTNYAACFAPLDRWPDGAEQIRVAPVRPPASPVIAEPPPLDKVPAHDHWVEVVDEATGESHWVKPSSGQKATVRPSDGAERAEDWIVCHDTVFKVDYYFNKVTKVSTWSRPAVLPEHKTFEEIRNLHAPDPVRDAKIEADLRRRIANNPLYAKHDKNSYVSTTDQDGLDAALKGKSSYEALRDEDGVIEGSKVGDVFVVNNGVIRETLWTCTSTESGGVVRTVRVAPTKTVTLQNSKTIESITASARLMLPYFVELIELITTETGGTAIVPGLKGLKRSAEKVTADYAGDASRMVDILRASIVYDRVQDALRGYNVIRHMAEDGSFTKLKALAEIKQRFKLTPEERAADVGYKDINLQLVLPNSLVAELQITVRALAEVKEFDKIKGSPEWVKNQAHHGSHKPYELVRQLENLTPQARDLLLPDLGTGDLAGASGSRMFKLAVDLQNEMVRTTMPKAEAGEFLTEADANAWRKHTVYVALDGWLERVEKAKGD